jgi:hypothetical protein
VAKGRVLSSVGQPLGGVPVTLVAWPPQSVVAAVQPGHVVPLKTVASAVTNSSGSYVIRLGSAAPLADETNPDGIINLALRTSTKAGWDWYGFSRQVKVKSGSTAPIAGVPPLAEPQVTVLRLLPAPAGRPGCGPTVDLGPVGGKKHPLRATTVGGTWVTFSHVTTWMVYGRDQSSSLGIGIDDPTTGLWHEHGTFSVSSGLKETYPKHHGDLSRLYRTDFVYDRYVTCDGPFVQAKEWAGGKILQITKALKRATFCVHEASGMSSVANGTAATFSFGVDTKKYIGIDLSAQTG